jgi:hypothetical protein|tara:strand:+ start:6353 stop:6517 length:165 start_codon:yes stop_codon:yes gene_type:complete
MLNELMKIENKSMTMREYLPVHQHRIWKDSYLNKSVGKVIHEIRRHRKKMEAKQ